MRHFQQLGLLICLLFVLMMFSMPAALATKYRLCIDANGQKVFTDQACPAGAKLAGRGSVNEAKPKEVCDAARTDMAAMISCAAYQCRLGFKTYFINVEPKITEFEGRIGRNSSMRKSLDKMTITYFGYAFYTLDDLLHRQRFDCIASKKHKTIKWQIEYSTIGYKPQIDYVH